MDYQKKYLTLILVIPLLLLAGCSENTMSVDDDEPDIDEPGLTEAIITMNNSGAQSYLVTDLEGEGASAEQNVNNPDIELTVGGRYTFINNGGAGSHPLDFRNSDREKLFGQSNASGSFDNDSNVSVEKDGNSITFTLTEGLAAELADYVCSFHPGMNGVFVIVE